MKQTTKAGLVAKASKPKDLQNVWKRRQELGLVWSMALSVTLLLLYWWTYGLQWLHGAYQLLDYNLLLHDMARSLWYCHSQPPLYNLLTGLALKAGWLTEAGPAFFVGLFLLLMIVLCSVCLLRLAEMYLPGKKWALVFATICLLNPSPYAYAYWFYDIFGYLWTLLWLYGWVKWLRQGRKKDLWIFLAALAAMSLTRSHFSWAFCLSLALGCGWLGSWVRRKTEVREMIAPFVVAAALMFIWPAKNLLVFEKFISSSWASYTLARATPLAGNWYNDVFRNRELHDTAVNLCPYPHPVLLAHEKMPFMQGGAGPNWNHYKLLLILEPYKKAGIKWRFDHLREWIGHAIFFYTKATMHDARHFLEQPPKRSGSILWKTLDVFCNGLAYADLLPVLPRAAITYLEKQKQELVHWLSADDWVPVRVTVFGVIVQPALILLACYLVIRGKREERALAGVYLWVMAYMYGTTVLTDGNEGYRFLFSVKGMHFALTFCLVGKFEAWLRQRQCSQGADVCPPAAEMCTKGGAK